MSNPAFFPPRPKSQPRRLPLGAALLSCALFSFMPSWAQGANEIGFIEKFALADNRDEALKQLVPGTEEFYYFHALHLQNQGQREEFRGLLAQWARRWPESAQRRALETRQALIDYAALPQETQDYLAKRLGLRFDHQRETPEAQAALPTALDAALVSPEAFLALATQGTDGVDAISERALAGLIAAKHPFTPAQRRAALAKLTRPDVAGLAAFIAAELAAPESRGFGEYAIHRALTLEQLAELRSARLAQPGSDDLLRNEAFVLAWLGKLQPGADEDAEADAAAREAWLERAWKFVGSLGPSFHSLKAHVLYQRLDHDRGRGIYDRGRFLEYVKLPRRSAHLSREWQRQEAAWRFPADLAADFSGATKRPPIGSDEPLLRDYLLRLLVPEGGERDFAPYFDEAWLKAITAEARLTAGVDDAKKAEALASALTPEAYEALKQRVDLDFDPANPASHAVADEVTLDVWIKNAGPVTVKIYELNTAACYEGGQPIGTDIDLDGLVPAAQRVVETSAPPLRRVGHSIALPEIGAKRGVWVADLIGNGRSSRALIRKGGLGFLARPSSAGTAITVLDEARQPLKGAFATFAGRRFDPQENGEIVLPFTAQPGAQNVLLHDGAGFASLENIDLAAEAYSLEAAAHIEREQLLAGGQAIVAIRPRLELNGREVSVALLEKPVLTLTCVDLDGIVTTTVRRDLSFADAKETTAAIKVPDRLARIEARLSGEVKSLSQGKAIELASSRDWALNGIERSEHISDVFLGRTDAGWFVEERGRNGEPKAGRPLRVSLWHRDFSKPVEVTLKTDEHGRTALGALEGIDSVAVSNAAGVWRDWPLWSGEVQASHQRHAAAGEVIQIATLAKAADCSLLELEAGGEGASFVKDWSAHLADAAGFVEVRDLPPGDYLLRVRPENWEISLRITHGQKVGTFLVSDTRLLEATPAKPLHVPSAAVEGDALVIRVANADATTRVHVAAMRYLPPWLLAEALGTTLHKPSPFEPGLLVGTPGHAATQYVSGRQLGDEMRYILERLSSQTYPGVMLPRPGLLLNPWAVRDTSTGKQQAREGTQFERREAPQRAALRMQKSMEGAQEAAAASEAAPMESALDFLGSLAPVEYNITPGADGLVRIPLEKLKGMTQVHVLAVNAAGSAARAVALPAAEVGTRDLRLAAGLDPSGHFAQQDEVSVIAKDAPFVLENAAAARFETYDHLGRVFTLLRALTGDATLAEFSFILEWPTFDAAKKAELYSQYACHELNFFLMRKDPAFFQQVILPYLRSKKERTFMDEYALGGDITRFVESWNYSRLNTAERLLLASRLTPAQKAAEVRALNDVLALMPVDREARRRQLETALRGYSLEADAGGTGKGVALGDASELNEPQLNQAIDMLGRRRADRETVARGQLGKGMPADPATPPPAAAPALRLAAEMALEEKEANVPGESLEDANGRADTQFAFDVKLREAASQNVAAFYRKLGVTQEWAENHYWHRPLAQQDASLVRPNRFWQDYAVWSGEGPFVSPHVAEAATHFPEMMLALAVLDLPFPSQAPEIKAGVGEDDALTLASPSALLLYHQAVKPAPVDDSGPRLLVSQNFFRHDDRFAPQPDGGKADKFVTGEFLTGVLYGAQVVVTNPTSSTQKLDVLMQIPRGALPASGMKETRNVPVEIEPFHTQTLEYAFYFPRAGAFPHFPVHVARAGKVAAFAEPVSFTVVDTLATPDTTSWAYVSQHGSDEEALRFLNEANLHTVELDKIAWRVRENADFFRSLVATLEARRFYHPLTYSYALMHGGPEPLREYLKHEGTILAEAGPWLRSALVTIEPFERGFYEQLEYAPLVNARAHRLGGERTILNDSFRAQYQRLLHIIAHQDRIEDMDRLAAVCALVLQDRVEEALAAFAKVDQAAARSRAALPYDYLAAWLALAREDLSAARSIAAARATEPVVKWREKFTQLLAQLDEIEGKTPASADPEDREQTQEQLAARQPGFDFRVEGERLTLEARHLKEATVNYYLMDLEFLFSASPFVGQDHRRFAQVTPNKTEMLQFNDAVATRDLALPREFQNKNVLVEITAAGQRQAQAVYANDLKVALSEHYGHLQVLHAQDSRPLAKCYVKVYAEVNGRAVFYKDGYTDLRGKFDYASLSTDDLDGATRFSILILSPSHGALVKEARPPRQ